MTETSKNLFTILAVTPTGQQISQQIISGDGTFEDACKHFLNYMTSMTNIGITVTAEWTWQENPLFKILAVKHGETPVYFSEELSEFEENESNAFNTVALKVHFRAKSKGWHPDGESDEAYIPKACANFHGETSELWEAFRDGKLTEPCDKAEKMAAAGIQPLTCEQEELADIIIRVLDYAKRRNVNIGRAIALKHRFNGTRPERHGGKIA